MKRWYVFDEADCFMDFDTLDQAAAYAKTMEKDFDGLHLVHMTRDQMLDYCATGKFPFGN